MFSDAKRLSACLSDLAEESNPKECTSTATQTSWAPGSEDWTRQDIERLLPLVSTNHSSILDSTLDTSLHRQYELFHPLTQGLLATMYPAVVIEYIAMAQIIKDYESKTNVLNLLNLGSPYEGNLGSSGGDILEERSFSILRQERDAIHARSEALNCKLQACRRRCIFEGHSLYNIDTRLGLLRHHGPTSDQSTVRLESGRPQPHGPRLCGILSKEIESHQAKLSGGWTTSRDRINCWLLDCLQSDEQQVHVQRSMLGEVPIDDGYWARQVLVHWYIDEAATGEDLQSSQSVGAVASQTMGSSNHPFHNDPYWQTRTLNDINPRPTKKEKGRLTKHPSLHGLNPISGIKSVLKWPNQVVLP